MSGGSYNYICVKEVDELVNEEEAIEEMITRLEGLENGKAAAFQSNKLLLAIREMKATVKAMETKIRSKQAKLSNVWAAVEWWDSLDTNEEPVEEALKEYEKGSK